MFLLFTFLLFLQTRFDQVGHRAATSLDVWVSRNASRQKSRNILWLMFLKIEPSLIRSPNVSASSSEYLFQTSSHPTPCLKRGKKRRKFQPIKIFGPAQPYCQTSLYTVLIPASSSNSKTFQNIPTNSKKWGNTLYRCICEKGLKEVNNWQKCLEYLPWEEFTQIACL